MTEKRKLLRHYLFSVLVIFCVMAFFCGTVAVKEKTEYNMNMTDYKVIRIDNKAEAFEITFGERESYIRKDSLEKTGKDAFFGMMGDIFVKAGEFFEKNAN